MKGEHICIIAVILLLAFAWYSKTYVPNKIKAATEEMEKCVEWETHANNWYAKGGPRLYYQEEMEQRCKDIHPIKYTYKKVN